MNETLSEELTTEQKLLTAAKKILDEKGYSALTIRRVCAESNCSTSTFYQYFESKDDLLLSFVIPDSHNSKDSFLHAIAGLSHQQAILEIYTYTTKPFCNLNLDVLEHFFTPENIALDFSFISKSKRNNWILNELGRHLHQAYEDGVYLPDITPWKMDKEIRILYYGCLFHWIISEKSYDLIETLRDMLTRYLNSCLKEEFQFSDEMQRMI